MLLLGFMSQRYHHIFCYLVNNTLTLEMNLVQYYVTTEEVMLKGLPFFNGGLEVNIIY